MGNRLFRQLTIGISALFLVATGFAQNVTPVTDFSAAPGNGVYSYGSNTPATVMDLIQRSRPRPAATAQGELVLPTNAPADAKLPAVVLVHGSGGIYPEQISFWAKLFNEHGIAVLVIDVFGPRGVKSTGEDQSQVPFAADTADAFAALGMLASHPRIDPKRIAVMGFSRGGITAVRSGVVRIIDGAAPAGLRFAAHVALYSGGCAGSLSVTPKAGVFSPEPMLFVHGDADDYAYLSDCQRYAQRIAAAGTPTEFVVLPGIRHKFDVDNGRRINLPSNTKTKEGCPLEFDIVDLKTRDGRSGEVLSQDKVQAINRELCADKGATIEGDRKARETAGKAVIEFLKKIFKA
ncbi:alpha/beta fold hydrolase [Rhodoferax sp.]|uniref:dienelactone hydrolase family protein n=1 Tax=Rhodoferax sp. TaxID=50421 RepID=UPI0026359687|nr:alpha/beta fold hydrolase [Rhodoferax sp.]MDD2918525.1 dienelactone hydrolase family protein [Rhodoferax sp.]